jgi:hypothetical protein
MLGIYRLATQLVHSRVALSSTELISFFVSLLFLSLYANILSYYHIYIYIYIYIYPQTNSVALSPEANYTERPPLVDDILVPTFVDTGVSHDQRGGSSTVVNLSFLDIPTPLLII